GPLRARRDGRELRAGLLPVGRGGRPSGGPSSSRGDCMRVTTFTRLWPNAAMPEHGVFVEERMRRVAALCDLSAVAPVPWWPLPWGPARWVRFARAPVREVRHGIVVSHPRYPVIPAVGLRLQGRALAWVARRAISRAMPDL